MDPMANLDGGDPTGAAADSSSSTKDVFDPIALNSNLKRIDKIRSFMGIVSGCVAGICGLTGLQGLGALRCGALCLFIYVLSFRPHQHTSRPLLHSLFLGIASFCICIHVGFQNEL